MEAVSTYSSRDAVPDGGDPDSDPSNDKKSKQKYPQLVLKYNFGQYILKEK